MKYRICQFIIIIYVEHIISKQLLHVKGKRGLAHLFTIQIESSTPISLKTHQIETTADLQLEYIKITQGVILNKILH